MTSAVSGVSTANRSRPGPPLRSGRTARRARTPTTRQDCRIVADVNSIQRYWAGSAARELHAGDTVFFTGSIQTGCGSARSQVGPFYCPADKQVYIDLGFFDELQSQFGAQGGPFAEAYVIAHEYGHHVQDLLGDARARPSGQRARGRLGPRRSCRRTATRGSGPTRGRDRADRAAHAGRHQRGHRRGGGGRRRPHPGARPRARSTPRPGRTARRSSGAGGSRPATRPGRPAACDTFTGSI